VTTWAILTGEYPPREGGVADYTHVLAVALARTGDEVHVFAPAGAEPLASDPGVTVHAIRGGFGLLGLRRLSAELELLPRSRHLLVQWVPHAYGWKAMNVRLAAWLARQPDLWVMFHEVRFPRGTGWKGDILSTVTASMAKQLARSARHVFVTIPAWGKLVKGMGTATEPVWSPVPSTLPTVVSEDEVRSVRDSLPTGLPVIGHFGTYGPSIVSMLMPTLRELVADATILLLGRGGSQVVRESGLPPDRAIAMGSLGAADIARHIAACDAMLQPYPDGASSRRTSLMAGLALGRAVVTNEGPLSEPIWRESNAVKLATTLPRDMRASMLDLIESPHARVQLGARARDLYATRFAVEHTVRALHEAIA
jgi:glycosyltransferase involved in cell wall biosynthesis